MRVVDFVQTRGLQDLKIVHYRGQVALKKDISTLRTALKSSEQQRYGKLPAASSASAAIDADSSPSNAIFEMSMDELDMDFLPKPILQTSLSNPSTPSAPSTYTMSAHQNNETLLQVRMDEERSDEL